MVRNRKVPPIIWTILCVLLLSLGATSYAKTANLLLIVARLLFLALFSIVGAREWWRYHHRDRNSVNAQPDAAGELLRRFRRWVIDEPAPSSGSHAASQILPGGCYQPRQTSPHWSRCEILIVVLAVLLVAALVLWLK